MSMVNVKVKTVDLTKSKVSLDKVLVDLSKNSKVDLSKHTAKVCFALDYSGSMRSLYKSGAVQAIISRLLPIALKFDDDGELDMWLFSTRMEHLEPVTVSNFESYVKCTISNVSIKMGGTKYAPVLEDIHNCYANSGDIPTFVIFITDGDNSDKSETANIIRRMSNYDIFVQLVGIGHEDFEYLQQLDNWDGRTCDNTGFIKVQDINKLNDEELYTELLRQYEDWLSNRRLCRTIRSNEAVPENQTMKSLDDIISRD